MFSCAIRSSNARNLSSGFRLSLQKNKKGREQGQVTDFFVHLVSGGGRHYRLLQHAPLLQNLEPLAIGKRCLERVMGIGPTRPAWKAGILPLNYTRIFCKAFKMLSHFFCYVNCFFKFNKNIRNLFCIKKTAQHGQFLV